MAIDELVRQSFLLAAFWLAVARFRGDGGGRLALGLALGAGLAHLGWGILHADRVALAPMLLADPAVGLSVLFVPLGPSVLAFTLRDVRERWRFVGEAARVLPLALACARLGCLVIGCCGGESLGPGARAAVMSIGLGDGLRGGRHPAALYELVGLLGLEALTRRARGRCAAALFATGFGLIRLVVEPWRVEPPIGAPWISVEGVAALWVGVGGAIALRTAIRARRRR